MFRYVIWIATFASPACAGDWPQYLGPNRDGSAVGETLLKEWPKDGPKKLWSAEVGSGWSAPVVVGGQLFIHHRVDDKEVLQCLDAASGKELWKQAYKTKYRDDFNFDDGPRSTPVVHKETIYALGADGDLTAFATKDGKKIWHRNLNADYQVRKGYFGVATSPMVVGGKLLINVGAKGAGIVAFDLETGKEIWKVSDQGVSYSSPVLATIGGEELAVFFTRQGLYAVTADKGELRYEMEWRPRIDASVNAASPVVVGKQIFVTTSYNRGAVLLEADKDKLKEVWKGDDSLSCHYNTPIFHKDHLYGIDGRQEGGANLRCVEWATGKVKWTEKRFGCATIIRSGDLLLALSESGDLVLLEANAEKPVELARATVLASPCRASFALSGGRVFARDAKKLVAIEVGK